MKNNIGNIVYCVVEIIIGILLLINPVSLTAGIIMMLGIVLAVLGISNIVTYFHTDPQKATQTNGLMNGLILVAVAYVCFFKIEWLFATFPLMAVFYGIVILITGINKLQWAVDWMRLKKRYWYVALIGALLSILFALVILMNPFTSVGVLWAFIAVSLIVEAMIDIVAYIFGRK